MALDSDSAKKVARELQAYREDADELSTATFKLGKGEGQLRMAFDARTRKVIGYAVAVSALLAAAASLVWAVAPLLR